jgi:transcriptional regulator with XRE-family HTH domain
VAKKVSNPIDVHVGDRVKVRRVELGLSQTQLGQALGITFQQVQKYEKGTNRVSASRLQQVSDILKVPTSYFFKGSPGEMKAKGNASPVAELSEFASSNEGLTLIKAFMKIKDAKVRLHIVNLVDQLAGD